MKEQKLGNLSAVGAVSGGILASTCCIIPLVLVSVGMGGAWVSNFQALAPYQPYFFAFAALSIGSGFWLSRRARQSACATDGPCADTVKQKRYVIGLWAGTILTIIAVGFRYVPALF